MTTTVRESRARAAVQAHAGLGHFLRVATRDRLLTRQEEADLGKRIAAADAALLVLEQADQVSPRRKAELRMVWKSGERARQTLVSHNMRLVVKMARTFAPAAMPDDYTFEDRIQDGTVGLMRAVDKFDPGKGFRFTTYASWWIRQSLQRGAQRYGPMQFPAHIWDRLSKLWQARHALQGAGGVLNVRSLSMVTGMSWSHVEQTVAVEPSLVTFHLDAPLNSDGFTLGEQLVDPAARPERAVTDTLVAESLRARLREKLTEQELFIMERRFGLHDDREWTLQELGDELGLTRERIRQIQSKVLGRLHDDATLRALM